MITVFNLAPEPAIVTLTLPNGWCYENAHLKDVITALPVEHQKGKPLQLHLQSFEFQWISVNQ